MNPAQPVVGAPRPVTPLGILAESLDGLVARAAATPSLDADFVAELARAAALAGGLDPYLIACASPESAALQQLAARTQAEDWAFRSDGVFLEQEMLSGHVEGQLLKFLVHATRARRVLEIGMFTGYSALAMAEALPADGCVVACELDPFVADFARACFAESPCGARIDVLVGPARDSLQQLAAAGESFDLVFVDADKAGYLDYLDMLLSGDLLAAHGVVCVDNTLMQGQAYGVGAPTGNGDAIAAFNRAVAADPRVEQVLVPLRDGVTLIRRAGDGT